MRRNNNLDASLSLALFMLGLLGLCIGLVILMGLP